VPVRLESLSDGVTTFGADVSLDGREWFEIPQTVDVPGPVTRVTVKEARAVLVND
jgi:hypothetical protein